MSFEDEDDVGVASVAREVVELLVAVVRLEVVESAGVPDCQLELAAPMGQEARAKAPIRRYSRGNRQARCTWTRGHRV